ncbi:MAG TPA: hypothetical protein PKO27_12920 [Deltaproteobacteria bacterium]|nr:MAG: hypothetical protein BWX92_01582 [Deltaproteobacteria bacterium ADurb.Bin135]HOD71926.1 hypothetical protein [Deltaproteobacteria bacterium]HPA07665.1 hypothetical protein [Methanoregulaceae archaeon]
MDEGLRKYKDWCEYLNAAEIDLNSSLRMVDSILDIVRSPEHVHTSPELCKDIQDIADRLRSFIMSRKVALKDLVAILEMRGIRGSLPDD